MSRQTEIIAHVVSLTRELQSKGVRKRSIWSGRTDWIIHSVFIREYLGALGVPYARKLNRNTGLECLEFENFFVYADRKKRYKFSELRDTLKQLKYIELDIKI